MDARAVASDHDDANTVNLVRSFAATQPSTRALVDMKTGRARTFAEFARDLDDTAAVLRAAGVRAGDRTALFVATGIELTTVMFACFQIGAVPVLIDPGMGLANMLGCIREQRPRALVGVTRALILRTVAYRAFASVEVTVRVGRDGVAGSRGRARPDGGASNPGGDATSGDATSGAATSGPAPGSRGVHRARGDDVAAILYTSGSTGPPKGVVYTHGMFTAQAAAIRDMFDIAPGEVDVACFLPFAFFSVSMGMTAVFPDMDFRFPARADPTKIRAALAGATSAFASPALWEPFARYLEDERAAGRDISLAGLERVLTAGAPVRPLLHERLLRHLPDGDVYTPYGATEALPVAFMNGRGVVDETAALTRQGRGTCVGKLAPAIEVRIVRISDGPIANIADAVDVLPGEIGEIVVRGPCVTRAYDRNDAANAAAKIKDGETVWHRMGDAGYLDERGRLWFCGRKNHRVETAHGALHSIPVEAQVETLLDGKRAALVGLGARAVPRSGEPPRGTQTAVVVVEGPAPALDTVRALAGCAHVAAVVSYDGAFPVDRRHNAKIEREALARWAAKRGVP